MSKREEYIPGQLIGDFVFIRELPGKPRKDRSPRRVGWFVCHLCGRGFSCRIERISSGHTKSCGCLKPVALRRALTTHGMSRESIYSVWTGMLARCYNPKEVGYRWYGEQGITVCEPWRDDFINFYNDVSILKFYGKTDYTLDRFPDKAGNYEPGNVRWADWDTQNNNRKERDPSLRNVRKKTYAKKPVWHLPPTGERVEYDSVTEAAEGSGISIPTIFRAIRHGGKTRYGSLFGNITPTPPGSEYACHDCSLHPCSLRRLVLRGECFNYIKSPHEI